uniref:Protein kinase domain-containing protein n=1 Tax=Ditylenchus dipsaci TaxID=166011 RepID=A0A915DLT2_9BILA
MSSQRSSRSDRPSTKNYLDWVEIGKGGFGVVFKARNKIGEHVAIKKIPRNRTGVCVDQEVNVLQKLNSGSGHNRIVKFFESFSDEAFTYIVMEYCERGTLREYIRKNGAMDSAMAADVLVQLVEGVSLMHRNGIMHRDLTASNVLISRITNGRLFVKIADFGLTKKTPKHAVLATCLGTPGYMAPQIKYRQEYGRQADVYSLGAILFVMLNARDPPELSWDEEGCPMFSSQITSQIDGRALDLLQKMMFKFEKNRIRLEEVESHPFIQLAHASRLEEMKLDAPPRKAGGRALVDSGRGTGSASGSNQRRSSSRCLHPNVLPNNSCQDCGFALGLRRNNSGTLMPVTNVPLPSSRRTIVSSEINLQQHRISRSGNGSCSSNSAPRNPMLAWPIPDIRHLVYMTTNKFGRFSIRSDVFPAMLYDNCTPNKQRLLVFKPKHCVPIPEKFERYVEKIYSSVIRLRSEEDVRKAAPDIKLGYKRLWQFIPLAKTRVTQCALRNAFGFAGFNMELKFSGTVELTLPDGRKSSQSPNGELNGSSLKADERVIFECGCAKLRQSVDMRQFEQLSESSKKQMEQFLRRRCVTTWAKMKPKETDEKH